MKIKNLFKIVRKEMKRHGPEGIDMKEAGVIGMLKSDDEMLLYCGNKEAADMVHDAVLGSDEHEAIKFNSELNDALNELQEFVNSLKTKH